MRLKLFDYTGCPVTSCGGVEQVKVKKKVAYRSSIFAVIINFQIGKSEQKSRARARVRRPSNM